MCTAHTAAQVTATANGTWSQVGPVPTAPAASSGAPSAGTARDACAACAAWLSAMATETARCVASSIPSPVAVGPVAVGPGRTAVGAGRPGRGRRAQPARPANAVSSAKATP